MTVEFRPTTHTMVVAVAPPAVDTVCTTLHGAEDCATKNGMELTTCVEPDTVHGFMLWATIYGMLETTLVIVVLSAHVEATAVCDDTLIAPIIDHGAEDCVTKSGRELTIWVEPDITHGVVL